MRKVIKKNMSYPCEYAEEEHIDETHLVEDIIHKDSLHEDEVLIFAPPFDEFIQASFPPAHEEENVVSYTPFQVFDVALFYDLESEEVLEEPLDEINLSCYDDKNNDVIDNIDEFIHVGRHKWDVISFGLDGDPIYDIEGHFQLFPLQQPYVTATDSDVWQQEYDMITNLFQPPRDEILQHSHDEFWSYLGGFDTYSFKHLDLLYEENFQLQLCSNFDEGKDMIFLE
jgi:hypothetical protein